VIIKKHMATAIAAAIALACNTLPAVSSSPDITLTPDITPTPTTEIVDIYETLDKKLLGVQLISQNPLIVGLAYDTNNNGLPDMFEAYTGLYNPQTDWIHLIELLETTYNQDNGTDS